MHWNSISSHQFRTWANFELSFWIHREISTVNGEIADIITMRSTRKFARGDKITQTRRDLLWVNYAFFITFKVLENPLSPINIWKIFHPPPRLLIFGKSPRLLATKDLVLVTSCSVNDFPFLPVFSACCFFPLCLICR